jgi:Tfp pilus assembly protein PilN
MPDEVLPQKPGLLPIEMPLQQSIDLTIGSVVRKYGVHLVLVIAAALGLGGTVGGFFPRATTPSTVVAEKTTADWQVKVDGHWAQLDARVAALEIGQAERQTQIAAMQRYEAALQDDIRRFDSKLDEMMRLLATHMSKTGGGP